MRDRVVLQRALSAPYFSDDDRFRCFDNCARERLAGPRQFDPYRKLSAFVVHDLKRVLAQHGRTDCLVSPKVQGSTRVRR